MRLTAITPELVARAIALYQEHAYGLGGGRAGGWPADVAPAASKTGAAGHEAALASFQQESVQAVPGQGCRRYSLRLGNRNYPFMKLVLQEHLIVGEYYFAVDTHDQLEIKPEYPDYDQWQAVRRFNNELKQRIEAAFAAAGLATSATLREQLLRRSPLAAPAMACRGLALIVDDEEDLAAAVELLLQRAGFRTCKVYDGLSGLCAARQLRPDLLVLDYELPELDGLQVIQQLRRDPDTRSIPVLLNSAGRVTLAEIEQADGFLAKPYPEALLYEMVDRVLQRSEVRR